MDNIREPIEEIIDDIKDEGNRISCRSSIRCGHQSHPRIYIRIRVIVRQPGNRIYVVRFFP
jgi:uncharacterized Zn-finger protein